MAYLPLTVEEMKQQHITQPDFVYVIGDAYIDHPSFGPAIISRVLQSRGYSVCIISQPDWKDDASVQVFGRPRLGFLVCSGNMDSMVNHYTVAKKRRSFDAYTPGGAMGKRPDYALPVYGNLIRRVYKDVPIIIGGIEASLRRLAHYDYWSDKVKRSVLLDAAADLLIYGMGEKAIVEIADCLNAGIPVSEISFVKGTVYRSRRRDQVQEGILLPDFAAVSTNKRSYAESFRIQDQNTDPFHAKPLIEAYPHQVYVIQNPPQMPLTMQEMDDVYDLPYMRDVHPFLRAQGRVAAIDEVKFSITSNRGCFGGCHFCSLNFHQGRILQVRSHASILKEAKLMTQDPAFKGYIHDVGGPTANFRVPACGKQKTKGACPDKSCLGFSRCPALKADHSDYLALLAKLRALPGVKKVFIRSGLRFDYIMYDPDDRFLKTVCTHHVSGQLRVAPEHVSDRVLQAMGKPPHKIYEQFIRRVEKLQINQKKGQYIVPYLMSSHPGATLEDAVQLAEYLRDIRYMPEQVQDFYPTPSTLSTCMYYTGLDPRSMQPVYVAKNPHEKAMQRALMQYRKPENHALVKEALLRCGRGDLIGCTPRCLILPRQNTGKGGRPVPEKQGGNAHERTRRQHK